MILLDTHAWLWWVAAPDELSRTARQEIDRAVERGTLFVSSISCWEIALLERKGRLELKIPIEDWISGSESLPFVKFVAIDNRIALLSNRLPGELHDDPADRLIAATALTLGVPLVSKDRKLRVYPHLKTIW